MKMKMDRLISITTLAAALIAIVLVLKRPATVVVPQAPAAGAAQADSARHDPADRGFGDRSFGDRDSADERKMQPEPATQSAQASGAYGASMPGAARAATPAVLQSSAQAAAASPKADSHADQISSAVAKLLGGGSAEPLTPDSEVGSGEPNIKDQQVTTEGDLVHGRFLTEIAGKDVWVTISGRMGQKDGYATFDPTEIKVGDMEVPVSLVNPMLQKKLAEERDRLKIPNN
jgi:hypothetical protein